MIVLKMILDCCQNILQNEKSPLVEVQS